MGSELKKTPLTQRHLELKARMAEFAGYNMPIQYDEYSGGMLKEHLAVREKVGVFDISHMGEFWVEGRDATRFLSYMCTRPAEKLAEGRALYCLLPNASGGIVDDIIIYKLNSEKYWVVVNASNIEKDWKHLQEYSKDFDVQLKNVSEQTGLIAVQGPKAVDIAQKLFPEALSLKYYGFLSLPNQWIVARTGYTGEDGFEVFLPADQTLELWKKIENLGAVPIGLGARDTLRLEVGFSLYGHELSEELRPLETFSAFAMDPKHDFLGSKNAKLPPRYLPVAVTSKIPKPMRQGEALYLNQAKVGFLTSGSMSPLKRMGMGLGLVEISQLKNATGADRLEKISTFLLDSGGKQREAFCTKLPFVETARVKSK